MTLERGSIRVLAQQMRMRKEAGEEPFVLVLGAGASIGSGVPSIAKIIAEILRDLSNRNPRIMREDERIREFYRVLSDLSEMDRYLLLKELFKGARPSEGYRHLAELIKAGYFRIVLSTNIDSLLEDTLHHVGLSRQHFDILVVGLHEPTEINKQMKYPSPRVKLVKLHGDLISRKFNFTPEETSEFPSGIAAIVQEYMQDDVLIVGHSFGDNDLIRCTPGGGGVIWYINPHHPQPQTDTFIWNAMWARRGSRFVDGEEGRFDNFLQRLTHLLEVSPDESWNWKALEGGLREIREVLQRIDDNTGRMRMEFSAALDGVEGTLQTIESRTHETLRQVILLRD